MSDQSKQPQGSEPPNGSGSAEGPRPSDLAEYGVDATLVPRPDKDSEDATLLGPTDGLPEPEDLDVQQGAEGTWSAGEKIRYFGDYELIREIARGGMGVVYLAKQTSLDRLVALKMILAGQLAGAEEVQRFHTEAAAAANLDHPGIVPVYEVGELGGQHYFSMGYVDGPSLSELIADHPLGPREAAALTLKIAEAIAYAHEQGVIHRDLKPSNVLTQQRSEGPGSSSTVSLSNGSSSHSNMAISPRVTDFGLAKQIQGDDQLTASGQILGTPSYMPPEQASGDIEKIDFRADIYSLGGILYALVTGRPPFQAANPLDTLVQVLEQDPVPPRQLNPQLPRDIETISLKCLEKEPARRYQTATELAEDLTRFLAGEPIKARSIKPTERAWRWAKRKPVVAGLGALAAGLLLVVSIGGPLAAIQQAELRLIAEDNEAVAISARLAAENSALAEAKAKNLANAAAAAAQESEKRERSERDRAESALYLSDVRLATEYLRAGQHADARGRLQQHIPDAGQRDRRRWEWFYLFGRTDPSIASWNTELGNAESVAWSPDGKQILSGQWRGGGCTIWDAGDGSKIRGLEGGKMLTYGVDWHSRTNKVVWGCAQNDIQVRILDLDDDAMTLLKEDTGSHRCVRWSPAGNRIALGTIDRGKQGNTVVIWENGEEGWQLLSKASTEGRKGVEDLVWSPSGSELLVVGRQSITWVMKPETLEVKRKTTSRDIFSAAWHPNQPLIACGKGSGTILVLDSETMEIRRQLDAHLGRVTTLSWSADGELLASGSADQSVKIWKGDELELVSSFVGHQGIVNEVRWNPDSTQVASCGIDGRISIWPREQDSEPVEIEFHEDGWGVRRFEWINDRAIRASRTTSEVVDRNASTGELVDRFAANGKGWRVLSHNRMYRHVRGGIDVADINNDSSNPVTVKSARNVWGNRFDEKFVAYFQLAPNFDDGGGDFFVRNLQTDAKTRLGEEQLAVVRSIEWSPDQRWIAAIGGGLASDNGSAMYAGWVNLFDSESGMLRDRSRIGENRILGLSASWSPDSTALVAGNDEGLCQVYEMPDLKTKFSARVHRLAVTTLSWHPSDDRIASGSNDRTVVIWDARTGEEFLTFTLEEPVKHVAWSPDGTRVAAMDATGTVHIWDAT